MYIKVAESLNYICKNICKSKRQTGKTIPKRTYKYITAQLFPIPDTVTTYKKIWSFLLAFKFGSFQFYLFRMQEDSHAQYAL